MYVSVCMYICTLMKAAWKVLQYGLEWAGGRAHLGVLLQMIIRNVQMAHQHHPRDFLWQGSELIVTAWCREALQTTHDITAAPI